MPRKVPKRASTFSAKTSNSTLGPHVPPLRYEARGDTVADVAWERCNYGRAIVDPMYGTLHTPHSRGDIITQEESILISVVEPEGS